MMPFFSQLESGLIGMEACGSAHHWAREREKLGHEIRLMAPQFVAPYRKNDKNDGNDAEAICEAVGRPHMRFVVVKSTPQQAILMLHRVRERLMGERTALINQARGLLGEYGIAVPRGAGRLPCALPALLEDAENALPSLARALFADLYDPLVEADERLGSYDSRIRRLSREMPDAKRLMSVAGVGPLIATALIASVGDARLFDNGRQFAAWVGLVPRQYAFGREGKTRSDHPARGSLPAQSAGARCPFRDVPLERQGGQ